MKNFGRRFKLTGLAFLLPFLLFAQKDTLPTVTFLHSPLGDYLYFLFNRKEYKVIPQMDSLIGTKKIPKLGALIALPEIVTSAQISNYKEVYPLLEKYYKNTNATLIDKPHPKRLSFSDQYPSYDTILKLVKQGEPFFPAFLQQWEKHVEPMELKQIEEWKKQMAAQKVIETFYNITKLSFKTKRLEIAAMAYHMAGSANYSPAGIYTSLFREPNLPWVVGHEGTHLLLSKPVGADWMNRALAKKLGQLAERKGESLYEIEENTCHFLQAMLAKVCGTEEKTYSIHSPYPQGFRREMLAKMEEQWNDYLKRKENIVDFMMRIADLVLQNMPDKS
jgi:hypothetical protein